MGGQGSHHDQDRDRPVQRPCCVFGRLGLRATPGYSSMTPGLLHSTRHIRAQQSRTCVCFTDEEVETPVRARSFSKVTEPQDWNSGSELMAKCALVCMKLCLRSPGLQEAINRDVMLSLLSQGEWVQADFPKQEE